MIKTMIPHDSQEVCLLDSIVPALFRIVLGMVFTLLDVIKKTLLHTQGIQGRINRFNCFVSKTEARWGVARKYGIVPNSNNRAINRFMSAAVRQTALEPEMVEIFRRGRQGVGVA